MQQKSQSVIRPKHKTHFSSFSYPIRRNSIAENEYSTGFSGDLDEIAELPISSEQADQMFTITNRDTGEAIDMRDISKQGFLPRFSTITETPLKAIEQDYLNIQTLTNQLFCASEENDVAKIIDVLDVKRHKGLQAQVNGKSDADYTALHFAANQGNLEACDAIISFGSKVYVDARNFWFRTPLHLSCKTGDIDWAKLFISAGADINAVESDGNTPCHFAAQNGHLELLNYLLSKDPDLEILNGRQESAYEVSDDAHITQIFNLHFNRNLERTNMGYCRTQIGNYAIRNSRIDHVMKTMYKLEQGMPSDTSLRNFLNPNPLDESMSTEQQSSFFGRVGPLDFEIIGEIGHGSFAVVYLVKHRKEGTQYAMKAMAKSQILGKNLVRYAQTERNVLADSSEIENNFIIQMHWSFQTQEKLLLILDYCPRGTLGELLALEKRLSEERARIYIAEIILAMEYLHEQDVIFRDLKPDNVLIGEDGHLKLVDFGLSKELHDFEDTATFWGSVAYLAPEMIKRKGHGKSMDWYMCGILLYEMLTGDPPFLSTNKQKMFNNITNAAVKIPKYVSVDAGDILYALLDKNPNTRLGSRGAHEIMRHEFFVKIDWNDIRSKKFPVPRPPKKPVRQFKYNERDVYGLSQTPANRKVADWTFIQRPKFF